MTNVCRCIGPDSIAFESVVVGRDRRECGVEEVRRILPAAAVRVAYPYRQYSYPVEVQQVGQFAVRQRNVCSSYAIMKVLRTQ